MIRMAQPGDAAAVAAIYRPIVTDSPASFELEPPDEREMARRIAATLAYAPWLVATDGAAVCGYAYASRHHERAGYQWSVNVSIYVDAACRRAGVGRALYRSLLPLLRLHGYCAAHAGITLPNAASVGLHEAFGFGRVAVYPRVGYKLGAWHDVGWWQLELRPRVGPPAPPRTPAEVARDPAFAAALSGAP